MMSTRSDIHILILEDDLHLRRGIALSLELQKFRIHQASNGHQGLELMRQQPPDIIISDINMPLMDGIQFLKTVRPQIEEENIPFVFLTGKDMMEHDRVSTEMPDDFITKPINTVNLLKVIYTNLLKAAEARHANRNPSFRKEILDIAITLESRDTLTDGHIMRVTDLSRRFGEEMAWPADRVQMLEYSAMLHDIGKITVPDHLLNKTAALNPSEWELIKRHTQEGAALIARIGLLKEAAPYVLSHHEKWDGSGYPNGLSGPEIPIESRVLALVDAFDGMTSDRPYRQAMSLEQAVQEIQSRSGKDFDPELVQLFLEEIGP